MAKLESEINVKIKLVYFMLIFIPFGYYKRVGEMEILNLLGIKIYQRVGNRKKVLFFEWETVDDV